MTLNDVRPETFRHEGRPPHPFQIFDKLHGKRLAQPAGVNRQTAYAGTCSTYLLFSLRVLIENSKHKNLSVRPFCLQGTD